LPAKDIDQLKRWSDSSVALLSGINTEQEMIEHGLHVNQMIEYLGSQYDLAAQQPGDHVLGDLVRDSLGDADDALTRDEVVSIMVQLVTAGNETTASLIGSAMMLLLRDQNLLAQLSQERALIVPFIEEVLRIESPFYGHFRVTNRDLNIAGFDIPAHSRVMLLWASANADKETFIDPATIDLTRENIKTHLSFGYGIHHCIGAYLARLEARVIFEVFLEKTANQRLAEDNDFRHIPSLFIRSLRQLTIEFDPA